MKNCFLPDTKTLIRPLFPGSSQADQVFKVCSVLGTPSQKTWAAGIKVAKSQGFKFPTCTSTDLTIVVPRASQKAIDLLVLLLKWNPDDRPRARDCLQHNWFKQLNKPQQSKLTSYKTRSHHKSTEIVDYSQTVEKIDRTKKTQTKAEIDLAKLLRTPPKTKLPDDLDTLLKLE